MKTVMMAVMLCATAVAFAGPLKTDKLVDDTGATALALNEGILLAQAPDAGAVDTAAAAEHTGPTITVGEPTIGQRVSPLDGVPLEAAKDLLDAIQNKKGTTGYVWLIIAAVLRLLVQVLRWFARGVWPEAWGRAKLAAFVDHPLVAYLLPAVVSAFGGVATSVAAGAGWFSADLLNTIITIAMGAIALYVGEKKIKEAMKAGKAGAANPGPTLNA